MNVVLISALNWLICATTGVTITAIAIWLLLRLCLVQSPAIQRFAWLLVLLPGIVIWRMSVVLPVFPAGQFSGVDSWLKSEITRSMSAPVDRGLPLRGPNDKAGLAAASRATLGVWACAVLLTIWVAGMIVLAVRWARSYWQFLRRLPQPLLPADAWIAELQDVCEELGLRRQIPLHVTQRLGPALCLAPGGYRLLVPQTTWSHFSTQQRRSILRHELAHYLRGDLWKSLLARVLASPQWFNPLAWLAVRRFEEAAECACDDVALAAEREGTFDYLRALLELGDSEFSTPALQAAVHGGSLQRRVRRLLSPAGNDSVTKRLIVVLAVLALAAGGFARIRFASAQSPQPVGESANDVSAAKQPDRNEPARNEPAQAPPKSLLANGGFEQSQGFSDDPEAWFATRWPPTLGHFRMAASPSVLHSGQQSVGVEIGDRHPDEKVFYNWTAVAKDWQPGETYELSGWVKVENAQQPAIILAQCWTDDGRRIRGGASTEFISPVTGTTDWTRVSTRLTVPEGTSSVRIRAGLPSQDNPGAKAWFDDLSLVKVAN